MGGGHRPATAITRGPNVRRGDRTKIRHYNIAYIRFQEKQAAVETIRISEELVVDMAPDGTIYGIELLSANEQLRREDTARLLVINEATSERAELPLAVG